MEDLTANISQASAIASKSTCTLKRHKPEDLDYRRIRGTSSMPKLLEDLIPANKRYQKVGGKRLLEDLSLEYHSDTVAIYHTSRKTAGGVGESVGVCCVVAASLLAPSHTSFKVKIN
jgi:hypothetical protein